MILISYPGEKEIRNGSDRSKIISRSGEVFYQEFWLGLGYNHNQCVRCEDHTACLPGHLLGESGGKLGNRNTSGVHWGWCDTITYTQPCKLIRVWSYTKRKEETSIIKIPAASLFAKITTVADIFCIIQIYFI